MRPVRLIAIITVMLLIVIIPVHSSASTEPMVQKSFDYYNFTSLSPGTVPASDSTFALSDKGASTGFNTTIMPGVGMNGLDVAAQHYGKWSALVTSIRNVSGGSNISILFSWNNRQSSSLTGDYVILENSTSTLLNITFGPASGYEMKVAGNQKSNIIGTEPPMNMLEKLSIFIPQDSSLAYFELENNSFSGKVFPVIFNTVNTGNLDNLSLGIGGQYCNLTMYNISYSNSIPKSIVSNYTGSGYSITSGPTTSLHLYGNYSGEQVIAKNVNSIIFPGLNGSLFRYNYYNGSLALIYNNTYANGTEWISSASWGSNYYFIISNGSSFAFITINTENLSLYQQKVNYSLPARFLVQYDSGIISILGYAGIIDLFNRTDPGNILNLNLLGSNGTSGSIALVQSSTHRSSIRPEYFDDSTASYYRYSINTASGAVVLVSSKANSPYFSNPKVMGYSSTPVEIVSMLDSTTTGTQALMGSNGTVVLPSTSNSTTFQASEAGRFLVSGPSFYYGLNDSGVEYTTSIAYLHGQKVWYNGSYGIISGTSGNVLFNSSTSSLYSPYKISITGNSSYSLTGTQYLDFNVSSGLQYTARLEFGNASVTVKNSERFLINSSRITNGRYVLNVTGINVAGYSGKFNSVIYIDNGVPEFNVSLNQSGFVSNTTSVSYSLNWSIGISSVNVSYLGNTYSLTGSNGRFPLLTGNFNGMMNLSFGVMDNFGKTFYYNYSENVIWNNPANFSLNIWNGEYLNNTSLNLKWSSLSYVKYYSLNVFSGLVWNNMTEYTNHTKLLLKNANYKIAVYANLLNNSSEKIANANITVINYAPGISLKRSTDSQYSFFGNSVNSTFSMNATTNVSSIISANIYSPNGTLVLHEQAVNTLNLTVKADQAGFKENGTYYLNIIATGLSRLNSSTSLSFRVNNTVPVNPVLTGSKFYTNTSTVNIGHDSYPNSILSIGINGFTLQYSVNSNGLVSLSNGTGTYNFTLTVYSGSMNYNTTSFSVYYYTEPPEILYSIPSQYLNNTADLNLSVAFRDPVPVKSLRIVPGNHSAIKENPNAGKYVIHFNSDGNYSVSIEAVDNCGNYNNTTFSVQVNYYPSIRALNFGSTDLIILQDLTAKIEGSNTGNMSETWYVNGREIGSGISLVTSLPFGVDNVTLTVTDGNRSASVSKNVVSSGPYIPAIAVIGLVALSVYRRYSGTEDPEKIMEYLKGCSGIKVRAILKLGKKAGLRRTAVNARMELLVSENKAVFALDPDGEKYFKLKK